jgi:small subunit ribosomal protein S6
MHLNEYESTFILRPTLDEAEFERLKGRLDKVIADAKGETLVFEDWGRRRMAYAIKKHDHGHYLHWNYVAPGQVPAELERIVRIEDGIIRFLTIKNADLVEVEERRVLAQERARKKAAAEAARAAAEAAKAAAGESPRRDRDD